MRKKRGTPEPADTALSRRKPLIERSTNWEDIGVSSDILTQPGLWDAFCLPGRLSQVYSAAALNGAGFTRSDGTANVAGDPCTIEHTAIAWQKNTPQVTSDILLRLKSKPAGSSVAHLITDVMRKINAMPGGNAVKFPAEFGRDAAVVMKVVGTEGNYLNLARLHIGALYLTGAPSLISSLAQCLQGRRAGAQAVLPAR